MPQPEWVTSVGQFPFSFRAKVCASRLGRYRRSGILIEGTDYETLTKALEKGYEVKGYPQERGSRTRFVYNVENCIERLSDYL